MITKIDHKCHHFEKDVLTSDAIQTDTFITFGYNISAVQGVRYHVHMCRRYTVQRTVDVLFNDVP